MLPELLPLLERLRANEVDFVVIGGVAVAAHGVVRATKDLDIVPAPTTDNLLALGNLLIELDARATKSPDIRFGAEHHDALAEGRTLAFQTMLGDIDVVQRLPGVPPYAALVAGAIPVPLPSGATINVASISDLRAMKGTAGRPRDLLDLEELPEAD